MPDDVNVENGFHIFHWKGQKRYRCSRIWDSGARCEYDTYDLAMMIKHASEPHSRSGKTAMPRRSISPIFAPNGDAIIKEEIP